MWFFRFWNKTRIAGGVIIGGSFLLHGFGSFIVPVQAFMGEELLASQLRWFIEIFAVSIGSVILVLSKQHAELETALANIRTLKGLLPICSYCRRVRDDEGYWTQVEVFVRNHSEANFTHGVCPDCSSKICSELGLGATNQ